jgi:hypothetical protein
MASVAAGRLGAPEHRVCDTLVFQNLSWNRQLPPYYQQDSEQDTGNATECQKKDAD